MVFGTGDICIINRMRRLCAVYDKAQSQASCAFVTIVSKVENVVFIQTGSIGWGQGLGQALYRSFHEQLPLLLPDLPATTISLRLQRILELSHFFLAVPFTKTAVLFQDKNHAETGRDQKK